MSGVLTFLARVWAGGFIAIIGWMALCEARRSLAALLRRRAELRADVARVHALAEAFVKGHA